MGDSSRRRVLSPGILIPVLVIAALVPLAFAGWKDLYTRFLEAQKPIIRVEVPRGIGEVPVRMTVQVADHDSGLSSMTVRQRQQGKTERVLEQVTLKGKHSGSFTVDFLGRETNLEPGRVTLSITAKDRSIWSNEATQHVDLIVDYTKPTLRIVSSPPSLQQGSSALVFYQAGDEELADSGVLIGDRIFRGFPARFLEPELGERDLYVALITPPLGGTDARPQLFADDRVGNSTIVRLPMAISSRQVGESDRELRESLLRESLPPLVAQNSRRIAEFLQNSGKELTFKTEAGSPARIREEFDLANRTLREINSAQILGLIESTGSRTQAFWRNPPLRQIGKVEAPFGTRIRYRLQGEVIGTHLEQGYAIAPPQGEGHVFSIADGVVIFADTLGVYGRVVGVDHGLGLTTIFSHLDTVAVRQGALIKAGEIIGQAGRGWLNEAPHFLLEMRVHGIPVDAREWWDRTWFGTQIQGRINEVRRGMGLPTGTLNER